MGIPKETEDFAWAAVALTGAKASCVNHPKGRQLDDRGRAVASGHILLARHAVLVRIPAADASAQNGRPPGGAAGPVHNSFLSF